MELQKGDSGRRNMNELIDFLRRKDEIKNEYIMLMDNCQDLARRVFNEIASNEKVSPLSSSVFKISIGILVGLGLCALGFGVYDALTNKEKEGEKKVKRQSGTDKNRGKNKKTKRDVV